MQERAPLVISGAGAIGWAVARSAGRWRDRLGGGDHSPAIVPRTPFDRLEVCPSGGQSL